MKDLVSCKRKPGLGQSEGPSPGEITRKTLISRRNFSRGAHFPITAGRGKEGQKVVMYGRGG